MKEGKDTMKKLLLGLTCASAVLAVSAANAQLKPIEELAGAAKNAATAAGAAKTAATAAGTAVRTGSASTATAVGAATGSAKADLLNNAGAVTKSQVGAACKVLKIGSADLREAMRLGVVDSDSVCAGKFATSDARVSEIAGQVVLVIVEELGGRSLSSVSNAVAGKALLAGAKKLAQARNISLEQAKRDIVSIVEECDLLNKRLGTAAVVQAMNAQG